MTIFNKDHLYVSFSGEHSHGTYISGELTLLDGSVFIGMFEPGRSSNGHCSHCLLVC